MLLLIVANFVSEIFNRLSHDVRVRLINRVLITTFKQTMKRQLYRCLFDYAYVYIWNRFGSKRKQLALKRWFKRNYAMCHPLRSLPFGKMRCFTKKYASGRMKQFYTLKLWYFDRPTKIEVITIIVFAHNRLNAQHKTNQ